MTDSVQDCENNTMKVVAVHDGNSRYEHEAIMQNKVNKCLNPICQPTVLINAKEQEFLKYVQVVSEWGCPLDYTDLRLLVNIYQSNLVRTVRHLTTQRSASTICEAPQGSLGAKMLLKH